MDDEDDEPGSSDASEADEVETRDLNLSAFWRRPQTLVKLTLSAGKIPKCRAKIISGGLCQAPVKAS